MDSYQTRRTFLHWLSFTGLGAALNSCEGVSTSFLAKSLGLPAENTFFSQWKAQAQSDYINSLTAFGGKLSQHASQMASSYDILIIGSGYGGAICAAELSAKLKPGHTIAVLERGKEWMPGNFPDTLTSVSNAMMAKDKLGLFDISTHNDLYVLAGSGLGGTSLINANVAITPESEVFTQGPWPKGLDLQTLDPHYKKVRRVLNIQPSPKDGSPKMKAHQSTSQRLRSPDNFQILDLAVSRSKDSNSWVNAQGMIQRGCNDCGDCMTGCNVGAKNTLPYNYLPLARRQGAQIFCEGEVSHIVKDQNGYSVEVTTRSIPGGPWTSPAGTYNESTRKIRAKIVIVAAGTLGSTGILLRSQNVGLSLSKQLGEKFSGNGDYLSFTDGISPRPGFTIGGEGAYGPKERPGPSIQSGIHFNKDGQKILIEDLTFPRAVVPMVDTMTSGVHRSMFYLAMGDDKALGKINLDSTGRPKISWPEFNRLKLFDQVKDLLDEQAATLSGKSDMRPRLVERIVGDRIATAHPLGGCSMGDSSETGVVDKLGNVFSGNGDACHDGLYVADGAVIPGPLGCNPFLTISAVATHIAANIRSDQRYRDLFLS